MKSAKQRAAETWLAAEIRGRLAELQDAGEVITGEVVSRVFADVVDSADWIDDLTCNPELTIAVEVREDGDPE